MSRGPGTRSRALTRECGFKVGSLGSGGISEAAYLGDWAHRIEYAAIVYVLFRLEKN